MTIYLECRVCGYRPPLRTMQEFLDALQRHLEKEHPFELSVSEHDAKSVNFAKKVKRVPKSNRKTKKSEKSGVP